MTKQNKTLLYGALSGILLVYLYRRYTAGRR